MMGGARRGCVCLKGAWKVVGIDDDDDSTFTITVDTKTFHFQVLNALCSDLENRPRLSPGTMVGRRGRWGKRKMDDFQDDPERKSKPAKEARIEAISLDASEPAHITLHTLRPDHWDHQEAGEEWSEDHNSRVSQPVEGEGGVVSQGTCWTGILDPPPSQVALGCRRVSNGAAFDCETQTYHFSRVSVSKVVVVPDSDTLETIKVEIDTDQQEEFLSHPLVCCVEGCAARSDADTTASFFTVPRGKDRFFWSEMLDIIPSEEGDVRRHVCGQHFITPAKVPPTKGKTRKKKTCDMLVAEEAEIIRQGLTSGRPKRTPKLNKNYDWVEIAPLIKSEPDEVFEESHLSSAGAVSKPGATVTSAQKHPSYTREDKENKKPSSDTEEDPGEMEEEEEEEEEDWENISQPSHPRAPPPKPKGRPHRIRDSGTQTEGACNSSGPRLPLREVKVQCNMSSEPPSPCTSCSYVNWLRLEELLVDCASRMEGDLCAPEVQECFRQVVDSVPHPTHATNVLKLLSGDRMDALEDTGDIVLVPNEEDEVEIENVIHTAVEEPITGLREIIPQTWQKKRQLKQEKGLTRVVPLRREEEEDLDGFGIREATEIDDEEFYPEYFEGEETEDDEDDQGLLDDEDWTIKKEDKDFRSGGKKKQKKAYQQPKAKKGRECPGGEAEGGEVEAREVGSEDSQEDDLGLVGSEVETGVPEFFVSDDVLTAGEGEESGNARQRRLARKARGENDERWLRGAFRCPKCEMVFSTKLKMEQHHQFVHMGVPPWTGNHMCEECGKSFTQKVGLQVHRMHKHGDPKQFPCHLCSFRAVTKAKLTRHLKSHTDERLITCEVCGAALKTTDTYRNHMALHTNTGRYTCSVCKKAFNHKQYYDDHCRSHFSLREYNCEICQMCFKTSKCLRSHIRAVHLNDKRMVCHVCGARFMTTFNLRSHMKKHARSESRQSCFQCGLCFVKFNTQSELNAHLIQIHPEQCDSIQVKVNSMNTASPSASHPCVRLISESHEEGDGSLSNMQHTTEERENADVINITKRHYKSVSFEDRDSVEQRQCKDTVKGIEAVEVEQQPKQQFTVIYVYDCNQCGVICSSAALLAAHHVSEHEKT
ncbi:Zinc finger and BTB domain-containing protein 24 [Chionoecetes opilio]|uniref:Zinc finger and BTB domain-containing protein 24 n=1 Tax=Chionoecetes opilio TaxID=41210 RepID=A0A8J5CZ34_CHIOP|nr:Zinc finger and BTB domain-containing protein 24 [Chionoecetes opilio]